MFLSVSGGGGQLTSVFCWLTDSLTDSGKGYLVCLFVIAALIYSLYATQFTHLKGTIQKKFKKKKVQFKVFSTFMELCNHRHNQF